MNHLILQENKGAKYLTVPKLSETGLVHHGFSTRIGGKSEKPFDSLNLGFHTGDDFEAVMDNRRLFAQALGIFAEDMAAANQVHGDQIKIIGKKDKGRGALNQETVIQDTDGLMTNEAGVPLIAFFADCVPVMFLDPKNKAIAISHAGWKGTVLKIGAKTVQKMQSVYGTLVEDLLVAIGPSIGPCHYEVDQPVIQAFQETFPNWNQFLKIKDQEDKAQLDLWEVNRLQLLDLGIPWENITMANMCTYCNHDLLYSYRHSGGKTGRLAGTIMLKEE